jgi:membrane-associated phospholipid phosphatase
MLKQNISTLIMTIMESLYKFLIIFDNTTWYVFMLLMGLRKKNQINIFYWGMIGAFLSILYNGCLKNFFKVPLMPHLGVGYALPSGHIELATFIYLWLAKFKIFFLHKFFFVLIPLLALAIVKLHFHTPIDAICGIIAGGLFFVIYYKLYTLPLKSRILSILGIYGLVVLLSYSYISQHINLILCSFLLPVSLCFARRIPENKV